MYQCPFTFVGDPSASEVRHPPLPGAQKEVAWRPPILPEACGVNWRKGRMQHE
jgi:hypothetical protein